jgi:hypothetical protein
MWLKRHLEGTLWLASFGSLILAAQTWAVGAYLAVMAGIFVVSTVVVIPLHFYRAWRRLRNVPNKRAYAFWVGLETLFAGGLMSAFEFLGLA